MPATDLVDISTACSTQGLVTTLGVVVDHLPPFHTKGSSSCVTFTIKDSDIYDANWRGGLKIKYFNDDESLLPSIRDDDVVLIRGIRVKKFNGRAEGVASQNDKVLWAIFRSEQDPNESLSITTGPVHFEPTAFEKRLANALLERTNTAEKFAAPQPVRRERPKPQPSPPASVIDAAKSAKRDGVLPVTLIQDLQPGRLTRLLGQVVKLNTYDSEKTLLYLTDYTSNESLMDIKKQDDYGTEGDSFNYLSRPKKDWPGPWGQLTIQVTLWDPHAGYAREHLKAGDLILLTYTRIKERGNGIEASVHEDRRFPDKVHIRKVSNDYDDRTQELMLRRKAYWKIHGTPKEDSEKRKKAEAKPNESKKKIRMEEGQKTLPAPTLEPGKNPNVKTNNYSVPAKSIESILSAETHMSTTPGGVTYQLPFQNFCYRPIVRVVDFFPPKLEDFAIQVPNKSIRSRGKADDDDDEENGHMIWEWRFCLLVEGTEPVVSKDQPRAQMKLFVSGAGGDFLLNSSADDLRRNPDLRARIREKLFILWGNLLEVKKAAASTAITSDGQAGTSLKLSSKPFACCVKEYGVRCGHPQDPDAMDVEGECSQANCFGWERRFAMFGTTIHS